MSDIRVKSNGSKFDKHSQGFWFQLGNDPAKWVLYGVQIPMGAPNFRKTFPLKSGSKTKITTNKKCHCHRYKNESIATRLTIGCVPAHAAGGPPLPSSASAISTCEKTN